VVCSEQIILSAGPGSAGLVASAVRSMLVGGLPFVLLDIGGDGSRAWIEDLHDGADLVLGDSALHQRAAEAGALWRVIANEGTARIHDLGWARLTPWREVLAEQFDAPGATASLSTLEEVTIEYEGSSEEPSPSAFLFAGWLSARLGWTPVRRDAEVLALQSGHGAIRLQLRRDGDGAARLISRVHLRASPPHPLDLEIARLGQEARASLRVRQPREEQRLVAFHYRDFATCLVSEIHRHEPNPTLEAAAHGAEALRECWRHVP
jgi:glucose-6-phosphate dehydrogenase assembly protein OpcA